MTERKMYPSEYFDAVYFGREAGERKSNYSAIGGYKHDTGAPVQLAAWVVKNLQERDVKVVLPKNGRLWPKAPKVLEIGCATGGAVKAMREAGLRAYGCDFSEYILSIALEDMKRYLYPGDMTHIQDSPVVKHAPFDVIVSKDVLEHATEETIAQILKDLGELAPRQFHVVNTGEFDYQAWDGDKTHNIRMPLEGWDAKAKALGLDIVFKET
jgi:SAM-dependent methyltransferase